MKPSFTLLGSLFLLTLLISAAPVHADEGPGGVRFDRNDSAADQNALDKAISDGFIRPAGKGEQGETQHVAKPNTNADTAAKAKALNDIDRLGSYDAGQNIGTGLPPLQDPSNRVPGEYEWESGKLWRDFRDGKLTKEEYIQKHKELRQRIDNPRARGGANINTREQQIDTGQISPSEPKEEQQE